MLLTGVAPACPFFPPSTTDWNWNHIPAAPTSQRNKELNERIFSKKKTFVDNAEQGENNNFSGNSQNNFTASIYYINACGYIRIWIIICTTFDSLSLTQARHSGEKSKSARQV